MNGTMALRGTAGLLAPGLLALGLLGGCGGSAALAAEPASAVTQAASPTPLPVPAEDCSDEWLAFGAYPEFRTVPDSRGLDAPVMLHGTVTDEAGRPLPGAVVLLGANPSSEEEVAIGSEIDVLPVAVAKADSAGRYELRAEMTPELRDRYSRDGLELDLEWFTGLRHLPHFAQTFYEETTHAWAQHESEPTDQHSSPQANARNRKDVRLDLHMPGLEPFACPRG